MNWKITAVLIACCMSVIGALVAQAGGDVSDKVQQLEKDMHQAQKNNDGSWFQQNLADGYIEGHSWGEWANKDEAIKQVQQGVKFTKSELSDVKVTTFGADTAIAHYKLAYDATFNGTHRARTVICSDTWINQSGTWKIASNHCSHVEGT